MRGNLKAEGSRWLSTVHGCLVDVQLGIRRSSYLMAPDFWLLFGKTVVVGVDADKLSVGKL